MSLKTYKKSRCPICGRTDTVSRVARGRILRILRPYSCKMKCRMCLTQFLVHRKAKNQDRRSGCARY